MPGERIVNRVFQRARRPLSSLHGGNRHRDADRPGMYTREQTTDIAPASNRGPEDRWLPTGYFRVRRNATMLSASASVSFTGGILPIPVVESFFN